MRGHFDKRGGEVLMSCFFYKMHLVMDASTAMIGTLQQVAVCDQVFVRQVCVTWVKKTRKVSVVLCAAVDNAF